MRAGNMTKSERLKAQKASNLKAQGKEGGTQGRRKARKAEGCKQASRQAQLRQGRQEDATKEGSIQARRLKEFLRKAQGKNAQGRKAQGRLKEGQRQARIREESSRQGKGKGTRQRFSGFTGLTVSTDGIRRL